MGLYIYIHKYIRINIYVYIFTGPERGNEKGVTIFTFLRFWQPFVKHTTSIACYESQDCKTLLLTSITCQLVDMSTLFLHCSSVWHSNEKPRITFWGAIGGKRKKRASLVWGVGAPFWRMYRVSGKTCITFFKKRASLFPKTCNTFSEVRITNFTNRPRFRKTFNQTNPTWLLLDSIALG